MKQVLSIQQVNENIKALKGIKNIPVCYAMENDFWGDIAAYYFWFRGKGIVRVSSKKCYWHGFADKYNMEDEQMIYQYRGYNFVKYVHKDDALKFVLACGLKKQKEKQKEKQDNDLDRLRGMKIPDYVRFYQLIGQVEVTAAYLENKTFDAHGWKEKTEKVLTVEHKTGRFSFPIEDIAPNINTDELKAIFFNLLKMPVPNCSVTIKHKIAA